ncbi:hypothetical protein [Propionivibrio sp.]|uniref:hypothetical protein n=1 Tax=Propionivibrio sp. TaxID=2212460 RepID=UPI003BF3AD77
MISKTPVIKTPVIPGLTRNLTEGNAEPVVHLASILGVRPWIPAFAGMTMIPEVHLALGVRLWIPGSAPQGYFLRGTLPLVAFAGMTR